MISWPDWLMVCLFRHSPGASQGPNPQNICKVYERPTIAHPCLEAANVGPGELTAYRNRTDGWAVAEIVAWIVVHDAGPASFARMSLM
jgi:hypothetical protein